MAIKTILLLWYTEISRILRHIGAHPCFKKLVKHSNIKRKGARVYLLKKTESLKNMIKKSTQKAALARFTYTARTLTSAQYRIASESWLLVSAAPGVIPTMLPPTHASTPSVDHHHNGSYTRLTLARLQHLHNRYTLLLAVIHTTNSVIFL